MKRDILDEEEVKNRIREFRHCCKAYNGWKLEMNEMIVQHHDRIAERKKKEQLITKHSFTSDLCDSYCDQFADDFAETMTFTSTIEGINYIDDIFRQIEEKYGSEARDVLWASYVDGEKEEAIEKRTGKTSRAFRKNASKWLKGKSANRLAYGNGKGIIVNVRASSLKTMYQKYNRHLFLS